MVWLNMIERHKAKSNAGPTDRPRPSNKKSPRLIEHPDGLRHRSQGSLTHVRAAVAHHGSNQLLPHAVLFQRLVVVVTLQAELKRPEGCHRLDAHRHHLKMRSYTTCGTAHAEPHVAIVVNKGEARAGVKRRKLGERGMRRGVSVGGGMNTESMPRRVSYIEHQCPGRGNREARRRRRTTNNTNLMNNRRKLLKHKILLTYQVFQYEHTQYTRAIDCASTHLILTLSFSRGNSTSTTRSKSSS